MRIVHELEHGTWSQFVDGHPLGNIFHTPEIFQVFAQTKGYKPTLWAAVDKFGLPLALMLPTHVNLFNNYFRVFTTRAIVFGSILYQNDTQGIEALDALLKTYARQIKGILFTELRNLTDLAPVQTVLQANGFHYEEQLNYLIRLDRPAEEVLDAIGSRTRRRIRRSLRKNALVINEITQQKDLNLFYNLVRKSYAAARVPLADQSLFEAAFDILYPKGMIKYLLAWAGGDCVAASAELIYKDTIFGWYSGVDRNFSSYVPNEILMWHILNWGVNNGKRIYDFGGAGKSSERYGVRDFKAKFGGDLVSYGRNSLVHSPLNLFFSKAGYELYRSLLWLKLQIPGKEKTSSKA